MNTESTSSIFKEWNVEIESRDWDWTKHVNIEYVWRQQSLWFDGVKFNVGNMDSKQSVTNVIFIWNLWTAKREERSVNLDIFA